MTYEYRCKKCDHQWEAQQKITEEPITHCPECNTENAERLISCKNGFILKGGGWFRQGY
jgi:putative FmdB family regulatory protein